MRHVRGLGFVLMLGVGVAFSRSVPAEAGSYTVVTTARMDAVLDSLLTRINAQRAASNPPQSALTADQLFQQLVSTAIGQYVAEYSDKIRADACAAFQALSPADQLNIVTALGGKNPCP